MGAGNVVPTGRIRQARPAGPGVAVNNGATLAARQVHGAAGRCRQTELGNTPAALQMPGGAIIRGWAHGCRHAGWGSSSAGVRVWGPWGHGLLPSIMRARRGVKRPAPCRWGCRLLAGASAVGGLILGFAARPSWT